MGPYKFNKTHLTNDEICTEETRETITTYIVSMKVFSLRSQLL